MAVTLPLLIALILFSIFIASRISTVCPTFTVSPIFTKISLTTPGSGDFTASAPELTDVGLEITGSPVAVRGAEEGLGALTFTGAASSISTL